LQDLVGTVKHLLVVVNREQGGKENLEKLGFKVHALAKISELVNSLCQNNHISKLQNQEVFAYLKNFKA
jgi:orotate phosphoribosyltransferase